MAKLTLGTREVTPAIFTGGGGSTLTAIIAGNDSRVSYSGDLTYADLQDDFGSDFKIFIAIDTDNDVIQSIGFMYYSEDCWEMVPITTVTPTMIRDSEISHSPSPYTIDFYADRAEGGGYVYITITNITA